MSSSLQKHASNEKQKFNLITELVKSLIKYRETSSTVLASAMDGSAKLESKIRRIERMYNREYLDTELMLKLQRSSLGDGKLALILDRTNWEYGNQDINAFVLYGCNREGVGAVLNLEMLDNKGGNSNSYQRISIIELAVSSIPLEMVEVLLGDREFFSLEFANFLIEKNIPFALRVRENLKFVQPYLKFRNNISRVYKDIKIEEPNGRVLVVDISVKRLKDEWLIVVSHGVLHALSTYRKRWKIERLFKELKTSGFEIERTRIKGNSRLRILFLLCSIAHCLCTVAGVYRHLNIAEIKYKRTLKCFQFSFFRYGADWLRQLLANRRLEPVYSQLIPCLDKPNLHGVG